ncbi:MAG: AraC family transcriptional regulator [Eubacteriales bacterium]|nr:AraC family transcriptional regulator [Eubacteriales bacterium]
MNTLRDHESMQRGSPDFPLDYHLVGDRHPRYEMPYHWHEEVEILHVRSGEFPLLVDGNTQALKAGDVAYIASGRLHGGKPVCGEYECVVFDMRRLLRGGDACRLLIADVAAGQADAGPYLPDGEARRALLPMFEALRTRCEGWALITLGCLFRFIGEMYRAGEYRQRAEAAEARGVLRLKRVFELIESRVDDPPTLAELSASVGMSPKYFCRFFKEATHRTPMDYVGFYRIEQACGEMAESEKNVTEIALDLGYGDVNYFIRCFKKYKGVTPKQYLLENRGVRQAAGNRT